MTPELTEAERAFDSFIASRREQGRGTYGQGLDHRDKRWSWERMALEELADACQYLVAEVERLRDTLDQERAEREDANAEVERLRDMLAGRPPRIPEGGC
jgi:chromosome segregation ATPase